MRMNKISIMLKMITLNKKLLNAQNDRVPWIWKGKKFKPWLKSQNLQPLTMIIDQMTK
jgi:hypothetical protein